MSTVAQTFVILGGVGGLFTLQSFWLARYLDARFGAVEERLGRIEKVEERIIRAR